MRTSRGLHARRLVPRQQPTKNSVQSQNQALVVAVIFVAIVAFIFFAYLTLRFARRRSPEPPRIIPTTYLRTKWRNWQPGEYGPPPPSSSTTVNTPRRNTRVANGISRVESIRSIMTLPEYRPVPAPDRERTIGREGERAGIDVVIEFPEEELEEEARREEHMETLYQIRLARQLERAARREQAAGGGVVPLENPGTASTAALMSQLQAVTERERRLSQVSYAEVGVQRADGSRIRPSMDSDRPLLQGAAAHGRSGSTLSFASSVGGEGDREQRRSDEIFRMGSARTSLDPRSTQESIALMDGEPSPGYDGTEWGPPPEYSSPVETRNRRPDELPVLRVDEGTPVPSRSPSPGPHLARQ